MWGFTLIELLVVIGIVAILTAVVILVLNPAELLKQARDSNRSSDLDTLRRGFQFVEAQAGGVLDLDGPNYSDSCYGGGNQRIFVSVPADNGEATATSPSGWQFVRVPRASLRNIDGTGWIPVDLREQTTKVSPPFSALPVDPVNTFASGLYYSYVCGSYEFNAVMESRKYVGQAAIDGGDNDNVIESGSDLTITPPRTIPGVTSLLVTGISPINGKKDTTVTSVSVSGGGFASGATVRLARSGYADVSGSNFSFVSSSTLESGQLNLMGVATGTWDVVIENPSLEVATLPNGFAVTDPAIAAPTVTSINPTSTNRGTTVIGASIVGTGFQSNSTVKLQKTGQSTITASSFTFTDSAHLNNISFTIPSSVASGTWDVVVQNPDTQFGTLAGGFTINAPPPITMTASSSAATVGTSTVLNWTHTAGAGSNRLLVVGISLWNGTSEGVSSITYAGQALTKAGSVVSTSGDKAEIWYRVAPATGANTVSVTASGQVHMIGGATSWINVDQTTPVGTFASAFGSDSTPTLNVSSAQGEIIQDVVTYFASATPGTGQSLSWINTAGPGVEYGAGSVENGASSVTMSWIFTASSPWALGAIPIKLAP